MRKQISKLYGPYVRKTDGRKHFVVIYFDGTKGSLSYPRWLMEKYLGRELEEWETVNHINNNEFDDRIENLQILSLGDNIKKQQALSPRKYFVFNCPCCGKEATKQLNQVLGNRKKNKAGPFCSRRCAGIATTARKI